MVPASVVGLIAGDLVVAAGEYWWLMGLSYVFTASLLIFSERVGERHARQENEQADFKGSR